MGIEVLDTRAAIILFRQMKSRFPERAVEMMVVGLDRAAVVDQVPPDVEPTLAKSFKNSAARDETSWKAVRSGMIRVILSVWRSRSFQP
jgi:hypothetical protein